MTPELASLEARLQQIDDAIAGLDARLRALEGAAASAATGAPEPAVATEATSVGALAERFDLAALLSLAGRTLMVFGGAYFLRALTDMGRLPRGGGIAAGLVYAIVWLAAADRAAAKGRPLGALFHGIAAVAIGLPLLWEASTRFAFLGAPASAVAVGAFTALALAVAWRRALQPLAGMTSLAAIIAALGLIGATGHYVPFAVLLILVGIATLWLGYDRDWFWLRWPAAFVADLVVVGLAIRASAAKALEAPETVIAVQVLLLAAYLGSFTTRTLVRGRLVIPFEVIQTIAVLAVGLGGAVAVAHASGSGEMALGAAAALLGMGCYAAAFAFVERRQGLGANFYFYATLALVLILTGTGVLLEGTALAVTLAGLGVLTTWMGHRRSRLALSFHGAVYAVVSAGVSGLLAASMTALAGAAGPAWPVLGVAAWVALVAAWFCMAVPRPDVREAPATAGAVPRLVLAVLVIVGTGGAVLAYLAPVVAGTPPDAGVLATLRTAIVAAAAVLLALATRVDRLAELGSLLYPVLVVGGLKLVFEDFRYSRPATLFLALALFGAALVAAPRIAGRQKR